MDDRAEAAHSGVGGGSTSGGSFPAPCIGRCVYGFVLFLVSLLCLLFYYLWAFVPTQAVVESTGITYLPSKYWAICLPIYGLSLLILFGLVLYPAIQLVLTPPLSDVSTVWDVHHCKSDPRQPPMIGIPPITDLPLDFVGQQLLL